MKRTTIDLEPELEVLLKIEMQRTGRPMDEIVRDALRGYLTREHQPPTGAGAYASGHSDTAGRVDEVLREKNFGAPTATAAKRRRV